MQPQSNSTGDPKYSARTFELEATIPPQALRINDDIKKACTEWVCPHGNKAVSQNGHTVGLDAQWGRFVADLNEADSIKPIASLR